MFEQQYDWIEFYKEFARKLLEYKDNRSLLIQVVKDMYSAVNMNMPTLELNNELVDIDPFTVFGTFNKSSMKELNRINIIKFYAEKMGINAPIPVAFNSIPTVMNQNATFYYFIDSRSEEDIPNLWGLFENAIKYAEDASPENRRNVSFYFDKVINTKGNANSKVTIGLYWVAPEVFFNLDSRCIWYVYESGQIPTEVSTALPKVVDRIPAESYFDIVEQLNKYINSDKSSFNSFMDLSYEAWKYSEEVNQKTKLENKKAKQENVVSALPDSDIEGVRYWLYAPGRNAEKWDDFYNDGIMAIGWGSMGDLRQYSGKENLQDKMKELYGAESSHKNDVTTTWAFCNEMKPGDIVFVKKGVRQIIGRGEILSDYEFDDSLINDYWHYRKMKWINKGEWDHPGKQAVLKTLTEITPYQDYVDSLNSLFIEDLEAEIEEKEEELVEYTSENFLSDVYMSQEEYNSLVNLLIKKKNVILQGAPGVGKTFAAKRLAYSMMGVIDKNRVTMIQFHQSYSYEDFILGYRPNGTGFDLYEGAFYQFCKKAQEDKTNDYFFIIDEINRGNLSKIFGELFMLIEEDKRGNSLRLLYRNELFTVPKNLYIIGMMNTADRSLAMLDYALRRRFAFFDMTPGFDSEGFKKYQKSLDDKRFDSLIAAVKNLNNVISEDESLGEGFCIGHSYFCGLKDTSIDNLMGIVKYELIPLIKEYWFDDNKKVDEESAKLKGSLKD